MERLATGAASRSNRSSPASFAFATRVELSDQGAVVPSARSAAARTKPVKHHPKGRKADVDKTVEWTLREDAWRENWKVNIFTALNFATLLSSADTLGLKREVVVDSGEDLKVTVRRSKTGHLREG